MVEMVGHQPNMRPLHCPGGALGVGPSGGVRAAAVIERRHQSEMYSDQAFVPAMLQAERWGWGPAVARVRRQYGRAIRIHRRRMASWTPLSWLAGVLQGVLGALAWLAAQPLQALSGSVTWGGAT